MMDQLALRYCQW